MIYIASLYILYIPKLYLCFHLTSCFWPLSELLTAIPFFMHQLLIFFDSCCCCLDTKQRWRKNCFGHANRPVQWTKSNIGSRRRRKSCPQFSFGDAWSGTCGTCKFSTLQCFGDMSSCSVSEGLNRNGSTLWGSEDNSDLYFQQDRDTFFVAQELHCQTCFRRNWDWIDTAESKRQHRIVQDGIRYTSSSLWLCRRKIIYDKYKTPSGLKRLWSLRMLCVSKFTVWWRDSYGRTLVLSRFKVHSSFSWKGQIDWHLDL